VKVALDVHYEDDRARAAAVCFRHWGDVAASAEYTADVEGIAAYRPGSFYLRELPALRAVIDELPARPELLVVDGYVWLGPDRPGLGYYLHDALGAAVPVVGVAKSPFVGATAALPVRRGRSTRPVFVTAVGIDEAQAADGVRAMAGEFRIPTLLKRVDHLARELASPDPSS